MGVKPAYYQTKTERLCTRKIQLEDVKEWQQLLESSLNREFIGLHTSEGTDYELAEMWLKRQIERAENDEYGQVAVLERSTRKFLGVAGIIYRDMKDVKLYEITYSLLPAARGKGYATDISKEFLNHAKTNFPEKNVGSIIHPENRPSIRVAEKIGLHFKRKIEMLDREYNLYL